MRSWPVPPPPFAGAGPEPPLTATRAAPVLWLPLPARVRSRGCYRPTAAGITGVAVAAAARSRGRCYHPLIPWALVRPCCRLCRLRRGCRCGSGAAGVVAALQAPGLLTALRAVAGAAAGTGSAPQLPPGPRPVCPPLIRDPRCGRGRFRRHRLPAQVRSRRCHCRCRAALAEPWPARRPWPVPQPRSRPVLLVPPGRGPARGPASCGRCYRRCRDGHRRGRFRLRSCRCRVQKSVMSSGGRKYSRRQRAEQSGQPGGSDRC
jgi:hypothetical protein